MLKDEFISARAGASEAASAERQSRLGSNGHLKVHGAIGFVGLGHMGRAMATNLAAAGYRVIAYIRRPDRMSELAALGLEPTTDITALLGCTVVISMLPDDDAVRDVVFGRSDIGVGGLNYNFAHLGFSSLAGSVYLDANNNGAKDPAETGISGVTVTLVGANDQGAVNQATLTAADGSYQFRNLRPGSGRRNVTLPSILPRECHRRADGEAVKHAVNRHQRPGSIEAEQWKAAVHPHV